MKKTATCSASVAIVALLLLSSAAQACSIMSSETGMSRPLDSCPVQPPSDPVSAIYAWLSQLQDPNTGLLGDQQDVFSRDYVNALGVMAFSLRGDYARAMKILNTFWGRAGEFYHGQCTAFGPGCAAARCGPDEPCGFFQDRNTQTAAPYVTGDRWMGDNAWLLMAIHHYQALSGDATYAPMAQAIARLLLALQQPAGYVATGWAKGDTEYITAAHAEGNLDAYKALLLAGELDAAAKVKIWLDTASPEDYPTINYKDGPLDLHTWRVLALGEEYGYSLPDLERTDELCVRYKNTTEVCGQDVSGFVSSPVCRFTPACGMDANIWVEGTGSAVVAFYKAGYEQQGDYYTRQLEKLLIEPAGFPGTLALPYLPVPAPNCPGLEWVDPAKGHVSGTAWHLFARARFDPYDGETIPFHRFVAQPLALLEAEYPDAYRYQNEGTPQCWRREKPGGLGIASGGLVSHMADGARADDSCWADYKLNVLSPAKDATVNLRYADDVGGDEVRTWWDGALVGSFKTATTGGWWQFVQSDTLPLGTVQPGLHTLRVEVVDNQTYGVAIDYATVGGVVENWRVYLPMIRR